MAARTERGLSVSIRVLVRSGTALMAEYPICWASNWATSEAVFTRCRRRCEIYRYENDATITVTKNVMVSTIFVFRRMRNEGLCVSGPPRLGEAVTGVYSSRPGTASAVVLPYSFNLLCRVF